MWKSTEFDNAILWKIFGKFLLNMHEAASEAPEKNRAELLLRQPR
jgi:hypothetical protein